MNKKQIEIATEYHKKQPKTSDEPVLDVQLEMTARRVARWERKTGVEAVLAISNSKDSAGHFLCFNISTHQYLIIGNR